MNNLLKTLGITALFVALIPKKIAKNEVKSFLGNKNLPRGIRNNNPGNLIISNIDWCGKIPASKNTDGHFEQFENFPYGIRAMMMDIKHDINAGKNTLQKLITAYAPPSENDTEAYIKFMESKTGWNRLQPLIPTNENLGTIAKAIAIQENGIDVITPSDLSQAIALMA